MDGHLAQIGVELLALKPFGGVLLVLGSDVPRHSGNAALLLLGALENDLHPVTFSFLCHSP